MTVVKDDKKGLEGKDFGGCGMPISASGVHKKYSIFQEANEATTGTSSVEKSIQMILRNEEERGINGKVKLEQLIKDLMQQGVIEEAEKEHEVTLLSNLENLLPNNPNLG